MTRIVQLSGPSRANLNLVEVTPKEPGPGEVRYRVHAFALNRADLMAMEDTHYFLANYPSRVGWEACGTVDAIGEGVTAFKVGDRVTAIPGTDFDHGTAGEYAITLERFLMAWPDGYSAVEATSWCMQSFTAYFPVRRHRPIGSGDTVLVTAGSSSAAVGMTQLVKYLGGRVISATRTGEKADFLMAVGADVVVATDHENLAERMREVTDGVGVQVAYDCLGGDYVGNYVDGMAFEGAIFIYGGMR